MLSLPPAKETKRQKVFDLSSNQVDNWNVGPGGAGDIIGPEEI